MSRKFGKEFAPARRLPPRKPTRCGRCRTRLDVRDSRYPAAGYGDVCRSCRDKLDVAAARNRPVATSEEKAEATREQVAWLVELAAERQASAAPAAGRKE